MKQTNYIDTTNNIEINTTWAAKLIQTNHNILEGIQ